MTLPQVVEATALPVGTDLTEGQRKFCTEFLHGDTAGNATRS